MPHASLRRSTVNREPTAVIAMDGADPLNLGVKPTPIGGQVTTSHVTDTLGERM